MTPSKSIVLIGNPNTGKTSLFNALTGLSQNVGNYPGVTVERKSGKLHLPGSGIETEVIDLPGTYSLAARSPDEMIAVDLLLGQQEGERKPDLILSIVDASNIDRNFYLLSQLLELDIPIVVVMNMMDVAIAKGMKIDLDRLRKKLKIPFVVTRADKSQGMDELRSVVDRMLREGSPRTPSRPQFPESVETAANELQSRLGGVAPTEVRRILADVGGHAEKRMTRKMGDDFTAELAALRSRSPEPISAIEARARYKWIREILQDTVERPRVAPKNATDRIDSFLTHKIFGTFFLVLVLALVFQAIYSWSQPVMTAIETGIRITADWASSPLPEGAFKSLLVNGVFAGAGSVLIFLPQILILFFFLSLLEDCGYMARAAFLMDKLMGTFGLSGKSVIPLLSSFACAVPGIMSTRTIENPRERILTILVSPLMSCSARLPVYLLMIGAFVPNKHFLGGWINLRGLMLLLMHFIGVLAAAPTIWIIKKTLLKMQALPFIMELPSYKWPAPRVVFHRLYFSGKEFVVRAGTIIALVSVVVWGLSYFPRSSEIEAKYATLKSAAVTAGDRERLGKEEAGEALRHSVMGKMGEFVEPVVRPLGWDWRIGMAVIASFPAREVVIATLGTIFNLGSGEDENSQTLATALHESRWTDGKPLFSLAVALSIMIFFALCCQCVATLATIRRETNSWTWPTFTFTYMTTLAYVASLIVYQTTHQMGW